MSKRRGASALTSLLAATALMLSPVAVPQAQAAAWEGTSAAALEEYAQRLVANVNQRRANHGLPALRPATCIDDFSAIWADWLDANNAFQHADMGRLMNRCGLVYASENLAAWKGSHAPRDIVKLWMNSDGHRRNILSAKARRVGVTVVHDRSRGTFIAVMQLGRY